MFPEVKNQQILRTPERIETPLINFLIRSLQKISMPKVYLRDLFDSN